jgi:hypothetical protein
MELVREFSGWWIGMNQEPLCYGAFLRSQVTIERKSLGWREAIKVASEEASNARPELSKMHHGRLT